MRLVVRGMREKKADVIVLETECSNSGAIALYEKLDFVRYVFLRVLRCERLPLAGFCYCHSASRAPTRFFPPTQFSFLLHLFPGRRRSRRLGKYYLNGGDAYRLKLWLTYPPELLDGGEVAEQQQEQEQQQQPAPEQQISDEERKARMEKRLNEVDAAISASS